MLLVLEVFKAIVENPLILNAFELAPDDMFKLIVPTGYSSSLVDDANKKMKIIIIVAAVVITIMIVLFAWMYSSQSEKIEQAQTTVAELQNTNEQLKLENEQIQLDNEFQSLENQFQSIETQSKSVRGVVNDSISKE